ncbi:CBM35 domain-containing protein [Salipiger sp. H15]|uniref:CBM35 domain-containing protein n=1 Tax=Alloyangia sp. H15 TaxID=3029062 RepID=A0AAU8AN04_9RHOB
MPIETIFIQGEDFVLDVVGEATPANLIRTRSSNVEVTGAANTGAPSYDAYGLRPGYTGSGDLDDWGYLDINGSDTGAQASTSFTAEAGTYEITLRLSNGGNDPRPISLTVDGVSYVIEDTDTGAFYGWETRTVTITLASGGEHALVVNQDSAAGAPNIDAIAIHDVGVVPNFSLPTFESEASLTVVENETAVGSVLASDIANDTSADAPAREAMTYAITGGADAAAFEIDPATGALRLLSPAESATQPSYALLVSATDPEGGTTEQAVTVTVIAPFAPVYLGVEALEIVDAGGTSLKRTELSNPEDGAVFSGAGDNTGPESEGNEFDEFGLRHDYSGSGYIDINGSAGPKIAFSFDAPAGTYEITLRYANGSTALRPLSVEVDGAGAGTLADSRTGGWSTWGTQSFTVTVGDGTHQVVLIQDAASVAPNIDAVAVALPGTAVSFAAPEILSAAGFEIAENSTEIGQVLADDRELADLAPDVLSYQLSGPDADKVSISTSGLLTLNAPADFELASDADLDGVFEVTVEVSDGVRSVTQDLSITVTDVEPELPSPSIAPIVLQSESGVIPEGAATFHRVQNDVTTAETGSDGPIDAYSLRVGYSGFGYTDFGGDGADGDETITWTVTVAEAGLYDLHIRYASVDAAATDRPLAVLVNGTDAVGGVLGFPERSGFANWAVRAPVQIALEAGENSLTLAIPAGFSNGPNIDAIAITSTGEAAVFPPVNSAPEFDGTAGDVTMAENATEVATGLTAADGEGDALSYELTGDDAAAFVFDEATGTLSFASAPDFEAPADLDGDNVYEVTLSTSDGVLVTSQDISVTVTDVIEATQPNSIALSASAVAENAAGAVIGTLSAVDPDGDSAAITFSVDPASDFEVVGGALKLKDGESLDFETTPSVQVAVTATDAANESTTTTLTITTLDVDEAPSLPQITSLSVGSGVAGAIIGTVSAVDPEGTAVSFSVDDPRFQIDGDDQLTLLANQSLDFATEPTVEVVVTAFDETGQQSSQTFVIAVTDPGATFEPIVIEAEDETLAQLTILDVDANTNDTQIRDADNPESNVNLVNGLRPDFSGTGYLDFGDTPGDAVTFTVTVAAGGSYDLNVRYASNGARPLDLSVNGGGAVSLPFVTTDPDGSGAEEGFDHWLFQTTTVTLVAGDNTLALAIPAGATSGPNVDRIEITEAGTGPIPEPDTTADEGNDLAAAPEASTIDPAALGAVEFALAGVDPDIVLLEVSTDGGASFAPIVPSGGTVTLDLSAFAAETSLALVFRVTDGTGNTAETSALIAIGDAPEAFSTTIQLENRDGSILILDDTGTGEGDPLSTQVRDASNPEGVTADRPEGIWSNYTGTGYLDMGGDIGDAVQFDVSVPEAGTYTMSFRYANGSPTTPDRPMEMQVNGQTVIVPFGMTPDWDVWLDVEVEVTLAAGANTVTLANTVANGPNIDSVTIFNDVTPPPTPSEPGVRETIRINFQDGSTPVDPDYLVGNFTDYGLQSNGLTYGFVTEASALDADGTTNTPTGSAYPAIAVNVRTGTGTLPDDGTLPADKLSVNFNAMDPRLTGYAHFDLEGTFPGRTAWEIELDNGWYEVTVSVGDTGGANDSHNRLFIEGALATEWTSTSAFKTELLTTLAHVQDGHLTLSAQGGTITEMQYLEIRALPDLTPEDGNEAPDDYAFFINPRAVSTGGEVDLGIHGGDLPTDIDPTSDIVLGVSVVDGRGGVLLESLEDGSIRIYETLTGQEVAYNANTTGGFDSVTIAPVTDLKPYTSYTVVIDGFRDRGDNDDSAALTREFQKFTTTFTTGAAPLVEAREVAFSDTVEVNSNPMQGESYTSIEMSPDKQFLYVTSITGSITRWAVNADGSLDQASKEVWFPGGDFVVPGEGTRGIIGIAFDPEDENTIWISDNYPIPLNGRSNAVPDFSGRISKVTLGDGGSLEDATIETYITGLPRSNGDHVTNSLEFRLNPDFVEGGDAPQYLLYLTQGSNSAMGAPDSAWGNRPERLLNAAILEIDRSREAPEGGFDVSTEPLPADGQNRRYADTDNDLKNGGIAITDGIYVGNYLHFDENGVAEVRTGEDASSELIVRYYDPFAEDAVLSIFAEGNRNGYDLVWHSNGYLYVPTNGSAAGGNVPDDPSTPENEAITNVGLQADYLFRMVEGGYYGHPNPLRDKYILNGANPTSGTDPNQVGNYPVGTDPDPDYDLEGAYNLGNNRSPNGAIEYMSGVFGTSLQHAVIFTQYSSGDNLRAVLLNEDGTPAADFILTDLDGNEINYVDPLDVIEGADGRLYMLTLNRANGVSQIIRLDAAPGGAIEDTTADEGGNLALLVVSAADPANVLFQVIGLDPDIQSLTISFDGGPAQAVSLDAQNRFSVDLSGGTEQVSATLQVFDDDGNTASTSTAFTPGDSASGNFIDASAFTVLDTDGGTLIRLLSDPATHETPGGTYDANGDGMNDGYDGAGYLDMNGGAEDKASFVYDAPSAGSYTLSFRMANGSGTPRPVAIHAGIQTVQIASTDTGSFATWQSFEITLDLVEGPNTVIIEQLAAAGGPNIDSVAVVPNLPTAPNDGSESVGGVTYTRYEAEHAVLDGAVIATDERNQSGGEFVDFDGTGTQSITWTVSVTEAGIYGMDILYALATTKAARPASLFVNGIDQGILAFEPNSTAAENVWGPQSAQVSLSAGLNTISISVPDANGANIDYLRVSQAPVDSFVPAYAAIDGEGRIELEATDDTTRTLGATQVEFYFTVAADDTYALDLAANAGAPDGAGLTVYLSANGAQPVEIGDIGFPGQGDAGETTAYVELAAGVQYKLTVISDAAGASALDYLDVRPAPGNDNADIEIRSNDPAYFDNRLHFSWIDDPDAVAGTPRDYKESATVTISNSGTEPLEVLEATITGPFELADPDVFYGLTLAAGQSINVQVLFDRAAYTSGSGNVSGVFKGALDIRSNDADTPVATVDLAGFWQSQDEGGQEPNLNEVWEVFGFGNRIEGLSYSSGGGGSVLDFYDLYIPSDETEVLSPYWRIADGVTEARITQIAAFHSPSGAGIRFHAPGDSGIDVGMTTHISSNNQTLLPLASSNSFATRVFTAADIPDGWAGNDLFGIEINNQSTDPRLNPTGAGTPTQADLDARFPGYTVVNGQVYDPEGNEVSDGYTVRMYQAVDEDGAIIENVFLGVMDYTGINYDYNDNMFVIEGVAPVYYGAVATIEGLDDAAADDRLVFSRIDNPANGNQAFRDSAVITITNDGIAGLSIDDLEVTGAFTISGLAEGQVIAPGASAQLTVTFIGIDPADDNQATAYEGTLTIGSSAGTREIALAGLAQIQSEGGEEPTVAQIVQAFGYSTDVAQGLLSNGGIVETVGDEVLLPYLQRLDDSRPIEVIQLAAYLSAGTSRLSLHDVSSGALTELYAQDDNQYQTLLPDGLVAGPGAQPGVARASIDRDGAFGLRVTVDGQPTYSAWSDPDANVADDTYGITPPNEGHYIRFFQAKDAAGNVIEGTFIGIQDYPGGSNFDYNDHMFLVTNVQGYDLSAAEDANADGINDALQTDSDGDGTPDFFDQDNTPAPVQTPYPGPAAPVLEDSLTVLAANFDNGGQDVSWNDDPGRDGSHPLRADTDVELVGSSNDIGYVQPGEWVEYTIDVAQAGSYALSVNAKTPIGGNTVTATLEDGTPLATFALPDSNGSSTSFNGTVFAATAATTVTLGAGLQTLRFTFDGAPASNGYILDFRSFTLEQVTVDPEPGDTVAPLVGAVVAADITAAGGASATVTITFSDDVALDASSFGTGDISVTGPNGALQVTGFSLSAAGNGSPRSVTYTLAAPGGSWDSADNGAYTVALLGGQVTDTSGNPVAANAALASFNVSVPDTPPPAGDPFRIEAETLDLQGFQVVNNGQASGDRFIQATGSGTHEAGMTFAAAAGAYAITVGHFDESDGQSVLSLLRNGEVMQSFVWNRDAGGAIADASSFSEFTFDAITLAAGDRVSVSGTPNGGEPLRVDYLDFTPTSGGGDPEDLQAPTVSAASAASIASAGGSSTTVTVTYADNVAIDASSIGVNDITVSGPGGALVVTGVSLSVGSDGTPRSATYTVAAPGGSWDTGDNGTYTVALLGGQVVDTSGNPVAANVALTSFSVAVPTTPPPTGDPFRVEAEDLALEGFQVSNNAHASGRQLIQATGSGAHVASMTFAETAGTYEITVGHFDESDGNAVLSLLVNGAVRETFTWNKNAGDAIVNASSFAEYTFAGVALSAGDVVAFAGAPDGGEPLRIDYLDFTPTSGGGPVEDLQAPTVASASAAGIASGGGVSTTVTVTYADNVAVDASTIGTADISVSGPGGALTVTGVTLDIGGDGTPRSATYTVAAPGGSWDAGDNGSYSVALLGNQVFDTNGNAVAANGALTGFTVAVPVTPPPDAEPVRVEAESMDLTGLQVTNNGHASGGQFVQATGSGAHVASFGFTAASGVYTLKLGYYDESDGQSQLSVLLNGEVIDDFIWDADAGAAIVNATSYAEREITGIAIETGDVLELSGTPNAGEPLRIDFLEYVYIDELLAV